MYEELVKELRDSEEWATKDGGIPVGLIYRLSQAADAIEELSRKYTEERNAAVELTGELASKPWWIPVTERLPEHLASVIVHRKDGGIFMWEYFDTPQTDECWIDDSMNIYSFYDVTHWMPLPQPPKGEQT